MKRNKSTITLVNCKGENIVIAAKVAERLLSLGQPVEKGASLYVKTSKGLRFLVRKTPAGNMTVAPQDIQEDRAILLEEL